MDMRGREKGEARSGESQDEEFSLDLIGMEASVGT